MADVEYVARVVIERVERRIKPAGTPVASSSRRVTTEDRRIRDKGEVASFAIRSSSLQQLRTRVVGMMDAALPDSKVEGEERDDEDEDEEPETD